MSALKRRTVSEEEALARLEELCARAEHCTGEIRERLWKWGISSDIQEKIIDSLIDRRFVDDTRFARAFVNDKVRFARWGRRKIAYALAAKRIDREIIRDTLAEIDEETYQKNLSDLIQAKAKSVGCETYEQREKILRFIVGRGYEPSLASDAIRKIT